VRLRAWDPASLIKPYAAFLQEMFKIYVDKIKIQVYSIKCTLKEGGFMEITTKQLRIQPGRIISHVNNGQEITVKDHRHSRWLEEAPLKGGIYSVFYVDSVFLYHALPHCLIPSNDGRRCYRAMTEVRRGDLSGLLRYRRGLFNCF
jgi:hypothetical protein